MRIVPTVVQLRAAAAAQVIKAVAAVGQFVRRRLFDDAAGVSDSSSKEFLKRLADAAASADQVSRLVGKSTSDAATAGNETVRRTALKALAELARATEAMVRTVNKQKSDLATASDTRAKTLAKTINDVVTLTDLVDISTGGYQGLDDGTSSISEEHLLTLDKAFTNVCGANDTLGKELSRDIGVEDTYATDALVRSFNKGLEDATSGILDEAAKTLDKALADSASASDTYEITTGKSPTDTATAADSLSAFLQSYAAEDFFASDYVGTQLTL